MTGKIIDGIVAALKTVYPTARVYTEQVKQGLKVPCFILRCLNPEGSKMVGDRYRLTYLFSVQYIPESSTEAQNECYSVGDNLFWALQYITVDGQLQRGVGYTVTISAGVLSCTLQYNVFVKKIQEADSMGTMEINNAVK